MAMPIAAPRYTVDQVRGFPEDGQRYELLDGVLLVTPAPRKLHQVTVGRLFAQIFNALEPGGRAVAVTPGELEIGGHTLLDPDILVYPAVYGPEVPWKLTREWWLAVEVLSPASRVYDGEFKRPAYQGIGVAEVWIVDPDARVVEVWEQGAAVARVERDRIEWQEVTIDLGGVWGEKR